MDTRIRPFFFLTFLLTCFISGISAQVKKQNDLPLKVDNETVFVKVTVADPVNRYITGFKKEHFKVFEDNVEQEIVHISQNEVPISVGILFDISGSMKEKVHIRNAINYIMYYLRNWDIQGECFVITFNQTAKLVKDFSQPVPSLDGDVIFQKPGGDTALYDAVYLGMIHVMEGIYDTKALIIITDGKDFGSRYSPKEIREFAKESTIQIYSISLLSEQRDSQPIITELANITGGRAFFPSTFNELNKYFDLIFAQLQNQYLLGYKPTNQVHDGKWRRIKVKLEAPEKLSKLKVHTREGYYAHKY